MKLFLVPTPIGNLRDITLRALDILKEVDLILCEDTRQSQKLLNYYEIKKPLASFHEHNSRERTAEVIGALKAGKTAALISDAGTPLISDPGFELVRQAIREKIPVEALPGPFAAVTALAASGLATDSFYFHGFLPQKSAARKKEIGKLSERQETLIFYESPFRLLKVLHEMKGIFGDREAVVAREISKKFEEYSRGYFSELIQAYSSKKILGEIVLLVSGFHRKEVLH